MGTLSVCDYRRDKSRRFFRFRIGLHFAEDGDRTVIEMTERMTSA